MLLTWCWCSLTVARCPPPPAAGLPRLEGGGEGEDEGPPIAPPPTPASLSQSHRCCSWCWLLAKLPPPLLRAVPPRDDAITCACTLTVYRGGCSALLVRWKRGCGEMKWCVLERRHSFFTLRLHKQASSTGLTESARLRATRTLLTPYSRELHTFRRRTPPRGEVR
jgi:hypothetical protein